MTNILKVSILLLMLTGFHQVSFAQNDTSIKRKNVFIASLNYQSRLHYFGRTDSLQSSGMYPTIGFETKSGFYGSGSPIFISNALQSPNYAGSILEAGYKFPETRNFSGNVFYNHFLYEKSSEIVQSALKGQTGANFTYNNKIVNVTAGGDLKFSDKTDIGATLTLDKLMIHLAPDSSWALAFNPTAAMYTGTQNFTQTYYKRNNVAGLPIGGQQLVTEQVQAFTVLSYELSLPIVFVKGKFNASITPSFVSPQNLVTVPNKPEQSEYGKNMFYVSASVGVRL
jgi:hypothetical protein